MTATHTIPEYVMKSYSEAVTESSLRASISVGLRQLAQAIDHNEAELFLSHSAPAQSACEQVSTWLKSHATTYDGRVIDLSWFRHLLAEELDTLRYMIGEKAFWSGNYSDAGRLFNELATRMTR